MISHKINIFAVHKISEIHYHDPDSSLLRPELIYFWKSTAILCTIYMFKMPNFEPVPYQNTPRYSSIKITNLYLKSNALNSLVVFFVIAPSLHQGPLILGTNAPIRPAIIRIKTFSCPTLHLCPIIATPLKLPCVISIAWQGRLFSSTVGAGLHRTLSQGVFRPWGKAKRY